jgi:hypothetical protein
MIDIRVSYSTRINPSQLFDSGLNTIEIGIKHIARITLVAIISIHKCTIGYSPLATQIIWITNRISLITIITNTIMI